MFLAGAFGAFLANRGISVFNDAVRPVVPEYREGRMTRVEFATTTFALSFGLIIGFGIPYSIMSPLILVHSLWLGTDVIGIFFPAKNIENWYNWSGTVTFVWRTLWRFVIGGASGICKSYAGIAGKYF